MNFREYSKNHPMDIPVSATYTEYLSLMFSQTSRFLKAKVRDNSDCSNKECQDDKIKLFEEKNKIILENIAVKIEQLISEIENC